MTYSPLGAAARRVTRCCIMGTALLATAGRVSAQQSIRLSTENLRINRYLQDLAGRGAFLSVIGGGVVDQIRGGQGGPDDFGSRLAARAAQQAVDVSVRHGIAALMHYNTDDHYQPCHCHGLGRKISHAVVETFTERRDDGSRSLAIPRFAGSLAGNLTETAWNHTQNAGDAVRGTAFSFGFIALFNIGKELTGLAH